MTKKNQYFTLKNVEKVINGQNTNFLNSTEAKKVCSKLKNIEYKIYYPYKENDVFSIKKHGKYKFGNIIKQTKNNSYIIEIYKYI